jgi:hypothetical protein
VEQKAQKQEGLPRQAFSSSMMIMQFWRQSNHFLHVTLMASS